MNRVVKDLHAKGAGEPVAATVVVGQDANLAREPLSSLADRAIIDG